MLPKPLLLIGGSVVAIALGGTRVGPIIALLLIAVIAFIALSPSSALTGAKSTGKPSLKVV